jgi:hypothetical protein
MPVCNTEKSDIRAILYSSILQKVSRRFKKISAGRSSIVLEIVKPKSVVDVGYGVGTWISVYAELGVNSFIKFSAVVLIANIKDSELVAICF